LAKLLKAMFEVQLLGGLVEVTQLVQVESL
jgi:hypothetical protein